VKASGEGIGAGITLSPGETLRSARREQMDRARKP